jgi:hypothetical protein
MTFSINGSTSENAVRLDSKYIVHGGLIQIVKVIVLL